MFAAAFMASSITEILRIIQVRFTGAVYKSSGRGAIWVRLIGTLLVLHNILHILFLCNFRIQLFYYKFNNCSERCLVCAFYLASPSSFIRYQRFIFASCPVLSFIRPFHCRLILPCSRLKQAIWTLRTTSNNTSKKRLYTYRKLDF